MLPNFREEKKLWKKGYKRIACVDEAGRGPLAGPVIAAAVMINLNQNSKLKKTLKGVKDSKKLTSKERERLYNLITQNVKIKWARGRVSGKVIDKINILEATKLAMKRSIENLKEEPDFLIIDGNFTLDLKVPQKSIKKADNKVFSCALASIIAKVHRDNIMRRLCKEYPQYVFDQHKGYPTKLHRRLLKKYGPCRIHRKSFAPVSALLKKRKSKA